MRIFKAELGALQLDLGITFGAAREIKERVADPMLIASNASMAARRDALGLAYQPRFEFTVENIPLVIWIGAKAIDPAMKLSDVQEACTDIGFVAAMNIADEFLAEFIAPRSKELVETKGDAAPGE